MGSYEKLIHSQCIDNSRWRTSAWTVWRGSRSRLMQEAKQCTAVDEVSSKAYCSRLKDSPKKINVNISGRYILNVFSALPRRQTALSFHFLNHIPTSFHIPTHKHNCELHCISPQISCLGQIFSGLWKRRLIQENQQQ